MSKKIEIPLEGKIIKSVPIKFPNKCVYCGALKQKTIPKTIKRKYSSQSKLSNTTINREYEMSPIDIPYCEQHFNEIKAINTKSEKFAGYAQYPLMAISAFVSLLLLYKPLYNWFVEGPKATFIPEIPGGVIAGFVTVMLILFGPALILFVSIGALVGKIIDGILKPPYGLRTSAFGDLLFDFQNEQVAEEFLAMNQELKARVPIKLTFKDLIKDFKKDLKENIEEARKSNKKGR